MPRKARTCVNFSKTGRTGTSFSCFGGFEERRSVAGVKCLFSSKTNNAVQSSHTIQIFQNKQNDPPFSVSDYLKHVGTLCGIVRFKVKHPFDPAELLPSSNPPKRAERAAVLSVSEDLMRAGVQFAYFKS